MKKIVFIFLMVTLAVSGFSNKSSDSNLIYEKVLEFYDNGTVKKKVLRYENCYKLVTYFNNGKIEEVGYFSLSHKRTGTWVRYNENGNLCSEAQFANDKKDGEWKIYDYYGRLTILIEYKNGKKKKVYSWSDENGLLVKK